LRGGWRSSACAGAAARSRPRSARGSSASASRASPPGLWGAARARRRATARLNTGRRRKELRNDWESNFAALLLYKQRTGLCHVHSTVGQAAALPAGACNPVLARWVQKQREAVARGELDAPRAARLRRVGFGVELWARDWQRWFEVAPPPTHPEPRAPLGAQQRPLRLTRRARRRS